MLFASFVFASPSGSHPIECFTSSLTTAARLDPDRPCESCDTFAKSVRGVAEASGGLAFNLVTVQAANAITVVWFEIAIH